MALPTISKTIPITTKDSVDKAFGAILRANYDFLLDWEPIAYDRTDIEGVHQMRVAFRRMRSALLVFRGAIPREITSTWSTEMGWAASELGMARDMDVFVAETLDEVSGKLPFPAGETKMRELAIAKRDEGYVKVRALLDSDRYKAFKSNFDQWLKDKGWSQGELPEGMRKKINLKVTAYAQKVLDKRARQMWQDGASIEELTTEELHLLRIDGKKLRYATDFFGPLFPEMKKFNVTLQQLQGLLGILNDITVMETLVQTLLEGQDDPELLKFAGGLVGWRVRQFYEVKGNLLELWKNFVKSGQPWYT